MLGRYSLYLSYETDHQYQDSIDLYSHTCQHCRTRPWTTDSWLTLIRLSYHLTDDSSQLGLLLWRLAVLERWKSLPGPRRISIITAASTHLLVGNTVNWPLPTTITSSLAHSAVRCRDWSCNDHSVVALFTTCEVFWHMSPIPHLKADTSSVMIGRLFD